MRPGVTLTAVLTLGLGLAMGTVVCTMLGTVLAGCKLTFDGNAPQLAAVGAPLPLAGLPRIHVPADSTIQVITTPNGSHWLARLDANPLWPASSPSDRVTFTPAAAGSVSTATLFPLDGAGDPLELNATFFVASAHYLHTLDVISDGQGGVRVVHSVFSPGVANPVLAEDLAPPPLPSEQIDDCDVHCANFITSPNDWFAYRADDNLFTMERVDGFGVLGHLPAQSPRLNRDQAFRNAQFDCNDEWLLLLDTCTPAQASPPLGVATLGDPDCSHLHMQSLSGGSAIDAGPVRSYRISCRNQVVVTCEDKGVLARSLDPAHSQDPPIVLDSHACLSLFPDDGGALGGPISYQSNLAVNPSLDIAYYALASSDPSGLPSIWSAPVDGSTPAILLWQMRNDRRLLAASPTGIVTSIDPLMEYKDAVDGWLGNWQFMERGRAVRFSSDGTRVRWLDHTARDHESGDFLSFVLSGLDPGASTPNQDSLHLAQNVFQWAELPDGRLLAADDQAYEGFQNRVILLDEKKLTAQPLALGASAFIPVSATQVLIRFVTADDSHDYSLLTLP